jgi:hypothetical protein
MFFNLNHLPQFMNSVKEYGCAQSFTSKEIQVRKKIWCVRAFYSNLHLKPFGDIVQDRELISLSWFFCPGDRSQIVNLCQIPTIVWCWRILIWCVSL